MLGMLCRVEYGSQATNDYGVSAGGPKRGDGVARVSEAIILVGKVPCQIPREKDNQRQRSTSVNMTGADNLLRQDQHEPLKKRA
jgi:hypothetical protein